MKKKKAGETPEILWTENEWILNGVVFLSALESFYALT